MADTKDTPVTTTPQAPANPGTTTVTTVASPTGSYPGGKETAVQDAAVPVEKRDEVPAEARKLARKHPVCALCGRELDVYQGANPHKQSTGVCPEHGRQQAAAS